MEAPSTNASSFDFNKRKPSILKLEWSEENSEDNVDVNDTSTEEANIAISANQSPEQHNTGYNIKCNNHENNNTKNQRNSKIFVGGLPWDVTEEQFNDYFKRFGTIIDIFIIRHRETQVSKGFGFVVYESHEAAERVLKNRYHMLDHKQVEVKIAVPKECLSFHHSGTSPLPSMMPLSNHVAPINYSVMPHLVPYNDYEALVYTQYQVPTYNNVCATNGGTLHYGYDLWNYNGSVFWNGKGISGVLDSYRYGTGYYDISNIY